MIIKKPPKKPNSEKLSAKTQKTQANHNFLTLNNNN